MSSSAFDRFTILLGAPLSRGQTLSETLAARGINLLRQQVSQVKLDATPAMNQPGYKTYISHLPNFIISCFMRVKVSLRVIATGMPTQASIIDWVPLPRLALAITSSIAADSLNQIKGEFEGDDYTKFGRGGVLVTVSSLAQLKDISIRLRPHLDPLAAAPYDTVNLNAMKYLIVVQHILDSFLRVHRYPAFIDTAHMTDFTSLIGGVTPRTEGDVEMLGEQDIQIASGTYEFNGQKVTVKDSPQWYTSVKDHPLKAEEAVFTEGTKLGNENGLWFPYISELADYDRNCVPDVISTYFSGLLSDEVEDIAGELENLRSAWGVISTTETGKMLSHIFKLVHIGLRAQARIVPMVENGIFRGVLLIGWGFTVSCNGANYNPGSAEKLMDALRSSGSNISIIRKIAAVLSVTGATCKEMEKRKSLWGLKLFIQTIGSTDAQRRECLELLKLLEYRVPHWVATPQSYAKAASLIKKQGTWDSLSTIDDPLPIHYSVFFSDDKVDIVWSCFGSLAPSFIIEGGQKVELAKPEVSRSTQISTGKGARKTVYQTGPMSEVFVDFVPLKKAIESIKKVIAEGTIFMPATGPTAPRSQFNRFKSYKGKNCEMIIGALSLLSVEDKGESASRAKRRLEGEREEGTSKKAKRAVDFF